MCSFVQYLCERYLVEVVEVVEEVVIELVEIVVELEVLVKIV